MVFTSVAFLVFFSIIATSYWMIPYRFRWILLLASSLVFYAWATPVYTLVLVVSVLFNYLAGIWIGRVENSRKRRLILIAGIIVNLLFLASFKYFNTLSLMVREHLFHDEGTVSFLAIAVPLGISFFTFSNISYLIEVKRGAVPPERHAGIFSLYVIFFPKLIMGPIERPGHFLPQLRTPAVFNYDQAVSGIRLMLWGYFKKLVIADQLGRFVDQAYLAAGTAGGSVWFTATVLYAFQIYLDFSGYIDIARGGARVLGFDLLPNFNRPYLSKSIREFWTRWHITLSQWLRDYLFLPVAYSLSRRMKSDRFLWGKTDKWIYSISITITFIACGVWHGVGWTYFAWGGLFAVYLVVGFLTEGAKRRFYKRTRLAEVKWFYNSLQVIVTFFLVWFTWIFFRAPSMHEAFAVISYIFAGDRSIFHPDLVSVYRFVGTSGLHPVEFLLVILLIPAAGASEKYFTEFPVEKGFSRFPAFARWGIYYTLVLLIFYFGRYDSNSFIYFQF
jgi:alginate O-acetyltransferase complex protein AlgI